MSIIDKYVSKEVKELIYFLFILLKNVELIDILKIIFIINKLKNIEKKNLVINYIKYLYNLNILEKRKKFSSNKKKKKVLFIVHIKVLK